MPRLALRLLGPPRLERDGEPVHIGRRKAVALLAYLAVTGRPHSRDRLATLFWPEHDESSARAEVRRTLSVLNRALGEGWLVADCDSATVSADAHLWVDVTRFRHLLATCQRHGHRAPEACAECGALLEEAVELYEDDFLTGFTLHDSRGFDEWQLFETETLRDELGSVLERLARWHGAQGAHEAAIRHGRRWVALDPLHEPAQRALMELYAGAGQRPAALRQYEECTRVLKAELCLPPSRETTALCERIRAGPAESAEAPAPPPARRHNLPLQAIPLVGRERELAEIGDWLADPACRMLTLVGPGGSGKTRLAIEAAVPLVDDFEHGVFFVSLVGLQSADSIVPTVGQAIAFPFRAQQDPEEQLLAYLARRRMLLVLDNFEYLLAGADGEDEDGARLVSAIVEAAPGVKVLVTSRAALRVQDEQLYRVGGLDCPDLESASRSDGPGEPSGAYSAIGLFVQSARRVAADFRVGSDNWTDVIRICRMVAGMPLGILLAAAWVRLLTPAEIVVQLEKGVDLLETDLRDVAARHRSMRAVFDHSWNLLTERQRSVMEALSVFRGGFTRRAMRAVAGASLQDLRALADRSLVQPDQDGRYEMHELLRQYAAENLAQSPASREAARDRHAAYYGAALEQWGADLESRRHRQALAKMDLEIDNARIAWDWAVARADGKLLSQAAEGLSLYYVHRGLDGEAEVVFGAAAERLRGPDGLGDAVADDTAMALAWMLQLQGEFELRLGRDGLGRDPLEEGLDILRRCELAGQDTRAQEACLLYWMAPMQFKTGRGDFRESLERSLSLARSVGDQWRVAMVLDLLGWIVDDEAGDLREARKKHEESRALCRALGDEHGVARATNCLAWVHMYEGELEMAERLARESLSAWRGLGCPVGVADGLDTLILTLHNAGEYADSQPLIEERLAICTEVGMSSAGILGSLGYAELHQGQYENAREHLESTLQIAEGTGEVQLGAVYRALLGLLAVREGAYAEARRLCRESVAGVDACGTPDTAVWSRCMMAYAELGLGQIEDAQKLAVQALRWLQERGSFPTLVDALPVAALVLLDQGETERAVEIYALAHTLGHVANSQWYEDVVGRPIAEAAESLPPEVVAAARERGRARDVDATLAELIAEWGEASQRVSERSDWQPRAGRRKT